MHNKEGSLGNITWPEMGKTNRITLDQIRNFGMKFRKISFPFAPPPGISGIFGRMETSDHSSESGHKPNLPYFLE